MDSVYVIWDLINYGYIYATLDVLAYISIISAITIITIKNPIVSVLFLIILFIAVSSYLICSNITFLGLAYILVYVGAVSILFLFILMLINIRVSELVSETKNSIPLVLIVSVIFQNANSLILPSDTSHYIDTLWVKDGLRIVTHSNWEDALIVFNNIVSIGNIMYSVYGILILIVSIILLLAMVGAIAITLRHSSSPQILESDPVQSNFYKYNK